MDSKKPHSEIEEQLLQEGFVTPEDLAAAKDLRNKDIALSIQHNTPFQKLHGYVYYEKQKVSLRNIVGQQYAFENQILPLFQIGNNLTLAVSNPANIWGMQGLKARYPNLQIACVLITDEKFEQLFAILYGELIGTRSGDSKMTPILASQNKTVTIRDPNEQKSLIKKLYEGYRYYQKMVGASPVDEEESWFFEFVEESYQSICRKFGCNQVLYRFENNEKRTNILASPVA